MTIDESFSEIDAPFISMGKLADAIQEMNAAVTVWCNAGRWFCQVKANTVYLKRESSEMGLAISEAIAAARLERALFFRKD
jgi:hypothetical protein